VRLCERMTVTKQRFPSNRNTVICYRIIAGSDHVLDRRLFIGEFLKQRSSFKSPATSSRDFLQFCDLSPALFFMRIFILPLSGKERIQVVVPLLHRPIVSPATWSMIPLDQPVILSLGWKSLNDATSEIQLESSVSSREIRLYETLPDGDSLSQSGSNPP